LIWRIIRLRSAPCVSVALISSNRTTGTWKEKNTWTC